MLSYRVISMDACLIRLTTVASAQNKFMRSISLGYTWLHLQFCCSPIELRALIQCQLSKRRRKICIYLDQAANAQHGSKIPGNDFICTSVTFCWFSLVPGKCWIHIDLNFWVFPTTNENTAVYKSEKDHLGVRETHNVDCNHHTCAELKQMS